ncbi:Zeta-crystallin [Drechslerella dactyloides]|uniref:Probable quinone oxidoreductase n=1 Tax=Drechslerella dactyloides TaxID=74499 RepID=A0AAD6IUV3_DREDA|nr:Zeta-crystallin [Drechslerella dactyloides]
MATNRAIQISKHGGTEVLELNRIPVPTPGPGQVLIKTAYAGVNYIDTYYRTGLYPIALPFNLGSEGAGTVESVGVGVTKFKSGDHVVHMATGSYADFLAVPEKSVAHVPNDLPLDQAAAILIQGLTALTMLRESYEVKRGDTILVHAAAGGTGLILVQLAKALGAMVIATASSQEKLDIAKAHGADYLVNYSHGEEQWVKEVLGHTKDGQGVEAVYDGVGKTTFEGDLKVLRKKGSLVSFGNASGAVDPFKINRLGDKNLKLLRPRLFGYIGKDCSPLPAPRIPKPISSLANDRSMQQDTQEVFDYYCGELFKYVKAGQVKINIHKVYSLEDIAQAQKDLEGRGTTGKLLIKL